jgi:hypothetical protein
LRKLWALWEVVPFHYGRQMKGWITDKLTPVCIRTIGCKPHADRADHLRAGSICKLLLHMHTGSSIINPQKRCNCLWNHIWKH